VRKVANLLEEEGFRVELDDRNERLNYKILDAEKHKIPSIFVIGKREVEGWTVSVRKRKEGDKGSFKVEDIIKILKEEVSFQP
jgi:threonyl-tRNA synthetase (EC 6.1.1.3)/Ser-tRNA(Thr) hydrolase (EC 3.1.1.-)